MNVTVNPGSALIPTGTYPTSYIYEVAIDTSGGETVAIATAPTSNSRIDAIVGYIDKSVTPSTSPVNNANLIFKLKSVAGTVAGSPTAPSTAQIQTSIGASNPYIVLAYVTVGTNVTQIVNSNISDKRVFIQPASSVILPSNQLSNPYKFRAFLNGSNQAVTASTAIKVNLNAVTYDTGSNFDGATNFQFTAPIAGFYQFNWAAFTSDGTGIVAMLYKNNIEIARGSWTAFAGSFLISTGADCVQLAANDTIQIYVILNSTGTPHVISGSSQTYLSGYLVSKT